MMSSLKNKVYYLPYIATILLFVASVSTVYKPSTGWTKLINFGDKFKQNWVASMPSDGVYVWPSSDGYDGQFYAQLALDPTLSDTSSLSRALDLPSYRAKRILMPWIASLLGGGDSQKILNAYSIVNIISWLLLAFLLLHWFAPTITKSSQENGYASPLQKFFLWFSVLFSYGACFSVSRALPDLPMLLFIVLGCYLHEKKYPIVGTAFWSAACLARETAALSVVYVWNARKWRIFIISGIVIVLPLIIWALYVDRRFQGNVSGLHNFDYPFFGYTRATWIMIDNLLREGLFSSPARWAIYSLIAIIVQIIYIAKNFNFGDAYSRLGMCYALVAIFAAYVVWEGFTPATRTFLPMTFAFNVLLRNNFKWSWAILGNCHIIHGLWTLPYSIKITKTIGIILGIH